MKQLLIVTHSEYADFDENGILKEGSIACVNPSTVDGDGVLKVEKATENFSIMLGRGSKNQPIVIPEVDINSLQVFATNKASNYPSKYKKVKFSATITPPEIYYGNTHGIRIIKLGADVGERNTWTATYDVPLDSTMNTYQLMEELLKQFEGLTGYLEFNLTEEGNMEITGLDYTKWDVQLLDIMREGNVEIIQAEHMVIDKNYLIKLASQCVAGKGYNYTDCGGTCLYSPEDIPDQEYYLITLRFQVGRNAGKTRDEKVWQTVHIAIYDDRALSYVSTVLGGINLS